MLDIDAVLSRFDGVRQTGRTQWMARCPCHNDQRQSLAISIGNTGAIMITDHGGCSFNDIIRRVGLTIADITPQKPMANTFSNRFDFGNIVATYSYSKTLRKCRDKSKNFLWQHYENGRWVAGRGGHPHCLYHAGTVQDSIYIVEGEKDADTLATVLGKYAVSPENGAGGNSNQRKWFPEYSAELSEKSIRILTDNDKVGETFGEMIANELCRSASSIKLYDLTSVYPQLKPHGDISDIVQEIGADRTAELLAKLESSTAEWKPSEVVADNIAEVKALLEKSTTAGMVTIANTARNYQLIIENDNHFSSLHFNILRGCPEHIANGKRVEWTDADDAEARTYIESVYHLANRQKYDDGLRCALKSKEHHPVQELVSSFTWDGQKRVEEFLCRWMKADDTPYNRECSRLIFAGGINRAFKMGAKFDEVVTLIGGQGGGKSTICQWLALEPDFYASLKTISGQKGIEGCQGVWIAELEELLAVLANEKAGTKIEESAKAFLSTSSDFYRKPYDRRPCHSPRGCIFIGTTNRSEFLTDKTGNRRWYPVRCNQNAQYLYAHKQECQEYIRQCWAEMLTAYKSKEPLASPTARTELMTVIKEEQTSAMTEDWRVGVIQEYLDGREKTCLLEVWRDALHKDKLSAPDMKRSDSTDLAEILTHELGWVRSNKAEYFGVLGRQKAFYAPASAEIVARDILPF